jgi:tellurium resistance protein TerD
MALLLKEDGKVRNSKDFVFYGNLKDEVNSVVHSGDNLTGEGDGDDEQIGIDLTTVPADVARIKLIVNIYQAAAKNQNFGQIENAFVRLVNSADNAEVVRYDLTEDYSGNVSVIVAELYRNGADWKFKALGEGSNEDAAVIARGLGVSV